MKHILLNNLESKHSLVINLGQFMKYYKRSLFIKIFYEKCDLETKLQTLFNLQRILCKKESEQAYIKILIVLVLHI